jgi:hypothetical protein
MWLSYYCSCIVDFCVDKHNYRHIVNFKDHVHAESIPREEEQENHVYTIKLNVKYTVLSQKNWYQEFKEYFAYLAYFNGPSQYLLNVIRNVNKIVIYSYWTWKAENPPYECTWFHDKLKHVGKQKKVVKGTCAFLWKNY